MTTDLIQNVLPSCDRLQLLLQSVESSHSEQSDSPITLEEYIDVKHNLAESQLRIRQLAQSNHELKQEIAMLHNMVSAVGCKHVATYQSS